MALKEKTSPEEASKKPASTPKLTSNILLNKIPKEYHKTVKRMLEKLDELHATQKQKMDFINIVKTSIETAENPYKALMALERLLSNPNFRLDMFTEDIATKLVNIVNFIGNISIASLHVFLYQILRSHADVFELIDKSMDNYEAGKKLADSLLYMPANAPSYERLRAYMNFAYAITLIGEEKTRKLYENFDIEYYARYSKKTLNELYANIDASHATDKPVLLVVFNKNDHNGAFHREGQELEQLTKYYKVIVAEARSEYGFYENTKWISLKYGKIDTLIIGGHGEPDHIKLGEDTEFGMLDLTDEEELKKLTGSFVDDPTVVLVSCSTGKDEYSIGAKLSQIWGATLFAPKTPSESTNYITNNDGKIEEVTYDVASSRFIAGIFDKTIKKKT